MRLLLLYLVSFGFISAFAINKWASIPLILSLLILIQTMFLAFKNNVNLINNKYISMYIYLFLLATSFSYLLQVNTFGFQIKGFTHTVSYFLVIILYFLSIELSFRIHNVSISIIFKYISKGILVVSFFTLIEFISKNFFMFDFDKYIPRAQVEQFDAIYNTGFRIFFRSRGTTEESGVLAMYLLMFFPFVVYYYKFINISRKKLIGSIVMILLAIFSTFSAAGFIELLIALLIVILLAIMKKIKNGFSSIPIFSILLTIILMILALISIVYKRIDFDFLEGIFVKLTFSNESFSAGSRLERWNYAFSLIQSNPIFGHGAGIATLQNGTGSTNFYLEVLIETGFVGFLLILALFIAIFKMIFKMNDSIKYVYLFSIIIVLIHSIVISQYLLPWIWTLLAIISYHYYMNKEEEDNIF
ncbi:O-antigen ligase family protein [Exiguobacterium artemiae]|uniref:O-antigen ligase family protein n=1 Tax=Exiguobacterium artemiae TaxID=340145 RepID=UPI00047CDA08|nr:O-antigen ligase family protein [Exiguobacterium sibiricum]